MEEIVIMPEAAPSVALGLPVEVDQIERELKKLWQQGEGAMTRASSINLAVYSEASGSLAQNTARIAQITENRACRAIVIEADRNAPNNHVEAWISAHCHVSRAGRKQVCSEQLSFLIAGPCTNLLPSLVFSHLDSDLPFYLWWQGELPESMDPQLWAWVDRFVYDSRDWRNFGAQMEQVETARREAQQRIVLCDLNWTRLDKVRLALAQFFDHPASHHHFAEIENMQIDFAPGYRSTALLLAGWMAAQLNWALTRGADGGEIRFSDKQSRSISVSLRERSGEPISQLKLRSGTAEFEVSHAQGADLLQVSCGKLGRDRAYQLMPAGSADLVDLMSGELIRGGPHRVYLRAVRSMRELL